MPTNDERREVAARLREWADSGLYATKDALALVGAMVTVTNTDVMSGTVEDIMRYLADLIEPEERTCRIDTEESPFLNIQRWHTCGNCGTGFSCWQYTEDGDEFEVEPTCCPNCGARVKEDA